MKTVPHHGLPLRWPSLFAYLLAFRAQVRRSLLAAAVLLMAASSAYADKILVLETSNFGAFNSRSANLQTVLENLGHTVTIVTAPQTAIATVADDPANGHDQVWVFGNFSVAPWNNAATSAALQAQLEGYLNAGGAVYLQSEVSSGNNMAAFAQTLMQDMVSAAIVHSSTNNLTALALATAPAYLAAYGGPMACTGQQTWAYRLTSGMPAASAVMTYAPDAPAAAVVFFDGSQLAGGNGRLMVNGDLNLLQQQTGGFGNFDITGPAGVDVTRFFLNILGGQIAPSGCAAASVPVAYPDTFTVPSGGKSTSVLGNDFYDAPGNVAATTANSSITPLGALPAGISLNADGTLSVDPAVPQGSSFTLYYQLCKVSDPAACSTSAMVKLTVSKAAVINQGPATPVPTLSWWTLAVAATLLAALGLRRKSG